MNTPSSRFDIVDVARAAALAGMVGFHLTWDLANFGFIDPYFPFHPAMRVYSHTVASAFLALVGISLALAHRAGPRWRAFFVRLGKIVAAAALVTVGSYFIAPDDVIWFGILHCIAAASLIAALFLSAPIGVALAAGVLAIVAGAFVRSAAFDPPALQWIGLAVRLPSTLDWRPLLPWAGVVWISYDLARLALPRFETLELARWRARAYPARVAAFLGRHSLAFYLLHQPVLFAILYPVAMLAAHWR